MQTIRLLSVALLLALLVPACSETPREVLIPEPALSKKGSTTSLLRREAVQTRQDARRIGKAGGVVSSPEHGHTLSFPAGALEEEVEISMTRVGGEHIYLEFEPHGLTFPEGAEPVLTMSWASAADAEPSALVIIYTNAAGDVLDILSTTVDAEKQTITARLQHFSGYAVATRSGE